VHLHIFLIWNARSSLSCQSTLKHLHKRQTVGFALPHIDKVLAIATTQSALSSSAAQETSGHPSGFEILAQNILNDMKPVEILAIMQFNQHKRWKVGLLGRSYTRVTITSLPQSGELDLHFS
jgi:hypothetical protein